MRRITNHYLSPSCDCNIIARHPECPPTGRLGKNVYVQTTLLKFEERLPLEKIGSVLGRQGLGVTDATVLELLHRCAKWLRPEHDKILAQIRASPVVPVVPVVYTDQTGIKVERWTESSTGYGSSQPSQRHCTQSGTPRAEEYSKNS